jgi:hypothetical protein
MQDKMTFKTILLAAETHLRGISGRSPW